ncbi:hypothetical protein GPJ56_006996 [Histomonas meleagridis]|uniref:uncharacterized protein n=1 Tax=Histomonas meleagridis TaxID=135588 RepID=UPI003559B8AB|nr:hypothetical protein GPJ56_006996 [Histomonas meleagridis]KAH0796715.1 hypothetical protein GO595_010608 [Histomonas meleagridis]
MNQFAPIIRSYSSSGFHVASSSFSKFLSSAISIQSSQFNNQTFNEVLNFDSNSDLVVVDCTFRGVQLAPAITFTSSHSITVNNTAFIDCSANEALETCTSASQGCTSACISVYPEYDTYGNKLSHPISLTVSNNEYHNPQARIDTNLHGRGSCIKSQSYNNYIYSQTIVGDPTDGNPGPLVHLQAVDDSSYSHYLGYINISNIYNNLETSANINHASTFVFFNCEDFLMEYINIVNVTSGFYAMTFNTGNSISMNGEIYNLAINNIRMSNGGVILYNDARNVEKNITIYNLSIHDAAATSEGGTFYATSKNRAASTNVQDFIIYGCETDLTVESYFVDAIIREQIIKTPVPTPEITTQEPEESSTDAESSSSSSDAEPNDGGTNIVVIVVPIVVVVVVIIVVVVVLVYVFKCRKATSSSDSSDSGKGPSLTIAEQTMSYGNTATVGPTQDNPLYTGSFDESSGSNSSVPFQDDSDDIF